MERIYVLMKVEGEEIKKVIAAVKAIAGVKRADPVTGTHDLVITVEGEALPNLLGTVVRDIRAAKGIAETETLVVISDI